MNISELCERIDDRKDELYELLSALIKINSESWGNRGNEEMCARFIHDLCQKMELESDLFSPLDIKDFESHPDYLPGRNLENRYNVVARYPGAEDEDALMLMAHTDTVRIGDLQDWEKEPLSGEIQDGKIWGRGACDDKYAVATALFLFKLLRECGFQPKKNLLFAAYSDEEHGGSHGALAAVLKYPTPKIVNMDGRENQIWHCASGGQGFKYYFHTKEVVDSAKTIAKALPVVIDTIDEVFGAKRRKELEENRFYNGTIIPETSLRYMGARAGNEGCDLGKGEVKFVFYTDKTKEEIHNELKTLEEILVQKLAPLGIVGDGFGPTNRFFHYVFCEPDSEDIRMMLDAAKEAVGQDLQVCGSCLSDLSVISKYGSSQAFAFGCGRDFSLPGGAHQPNEFIACDKFLQFTKIIAAYILKVLG